MPEQGLSQEDLASLGHTPDSAGADAADASKQYARGTMAGILETGPAVSGAIYGSRLSPFIAPFMGPAAPLAPVVTGGVGFMAGLLAGKPLSEILVSAPESKDLVPYFEGGKTFGDTIAFAPAAFYIPPTLATRVGPYISRIGEFARKYPKSFLLGETSSGASTSMGTILAEEYAPGQAGVRFGTELTFGIANPVRYVPNLTSWGANKLKTLWQMRTSQGREAIAAAGQEGARDEATRRLIEILEQQGEDIPALIKALDEPLPGGPSVSYPPMGQTGQITGPTAAQKTGSMSLAQLESALGNLDPNFAAELNEQGRQALLAYTKVVNKLEDAGSPEALRVAAEMREQFFSNAINNRLERAMARAGEKIGRITNDTPAARVQIGQIVRNEVETALENARSAERFYWERADREAMKPGSVVDYLGKPRPVPRIVAPDNTIRAYLERVAQIGPELVDSMVPPDVRRIMESFGVDNRMIDLYRRGRETGQFTKTGKVHYRYLPKSGQGRVKPGDLINYRSNLLTLARQARGRGEVSDASFYSYLAESMLDDLSTLKNPAYNKAREFSNALNDTFTRTFANDLLGTSRTGADKFPVETLVDDAFGVGADLTALRMKEIENAVGFMRDRLTKAAAEAGPRIPGDPRLADEANMLREFAQVSTQGVASVQDAQNRILRLAASKATFLDPKTNAMRLNTRQLNKFVTENKPLLDQLGITGDLTNATQAENVLRAVLEQNSVLNRTVRDQTAFSQVLSFENPTNAIGAALRSRFPMRSMSRIARLAQRGGPEAMAGLKSSLYDYIFTKASGGTDVLDPQKFRDAFFKPLSKDQPSLSDIMRTQGIMTPQELTNIRRLTDQMMRIEDAMSNRVAIDSVVQGADAVTELAMRVIGSKIGTTASGGGPGALIAASAGSKAIRQIFDKMPMMMVRRTLQRAAQDPALMAQLLRRNLSEREKFRLAKSLHAYMLASGLNYATYEEPPEAKVAAQGPSAADQLQSIEDVYNRLRGRPQPPAPTTRGVPGLPPAPNAPPTGGVPGGAPPVAGGATPSRAMLQQLFPNDAVLGAAAMAQNPAMQPPPGMG